MDRDNKNMYNREATVPVTTDFRVLNSLSGLGISSKVTSPPAAAAAASSSCSCYTSSFWEVF